MIESRFAPAALLVSLVLLSAAGARAQDSGTNGDVTRASLHDPCCMIVAVDAETGIVTVKVNATGNVFQFKPNGFSPVDSYRAALASLKPGQAVYANFTNHQVSLDGRTACCTMTSGPHPFSPVDSYRVNATPRQPPDGIHSNTPPDSSPDSYRPLKPCCTIAAVNAEAGIVTVKVNATGNVFQFKPGNSAALASLKPGQAVYANFTNHQLSLDGRTLWAGQQLSH